MQLRRSGTNIALNGDFTFCALNDSNDLDVVKRPQGQLIRELAPHQLSVASERPGSGGVQRSFKGTIFQPLVKTVTRICNPRYIAFVIRTHWAMRIGFGLIDLFARYDLPDSSSQRIEI